MSLAKNIILAHIILTTVYDKAEEFNMFFSDIGKTTYERTQHSLLAPHDTTVNNHDPVVRKGACFRPEPVDTDTVILTIKSLKETKAVGSDGIPLRFLIDLLPVIISYITCIIYTSLATGIFSKAWKHAMVVALYKSGDSNSINNYKPISLLPVISKILEKIVANQLLHYLESNKLVTNNQHGFRLNYQLKQLSQSLQTIYTTTWTIRVYRS